MELFPPPQGEYLNICFDTSPPLLSAVPEFESLYGPSTEIQEIPLKPVQEGKAF